MYCYLFEIENSRLLGAVIVSSDKLNIALCCIALSSELDQVGVSITLSKTCWNLVLEIPGYKG